MTRVQNQKTHPFEDALLGPFDHLIFNVPMGHMPPPKEHVGLVENGLR